MEYRFTYDKYMQKRHKHLSQNQIISAPARYLSVSNFFGGSYCTIAWELSTPFCQHFGHLDAFLRISVCSTLILNKKSSRLKLGQKGVPNANAIDSIVRGRIKGTACSVFTIQVHFF